MAISFQKYVDITSGVGGAVQATTRELIGRLLTDNVLLPTNTIVEFDTLAEVGTYFGTSSEEYKRALFYFGWVSKLATTPKKISYARWATADTAATIIGASGTYAVSDFTSIADGAFTLTIGGDTEVITGLDFTTDVSLSDVATTIEAGVQAANIAAVWTGATVTFETTPFSRFELVGGATGANVISVANAGSGTEIADLIGWLVGARYSDGVLEQTVTDVLTASTASSNNFGSFAFIAALSQAEALLAAQWNDAQNVRFMFCLRVLAADAQDYYDDLSAISGTSMTLYDGSVDEYPEMAPMLIMAATPFNRRAGVQNYMFQQFALTPTVTDTTLSNTYDDIRTNYYGQTQQAGSNISFYQRGFMMGGATDPVDMGVYSNEVWLKDAAGVQIINLLLALSFVSANDTGRAQVLGVVQATIDQAVLNGTISVGKPLNATQIAYITQVTGDENAYIQLQTLGYWIDAFIEEEAPGDFKVVYLLLYSKNDTVRKVEGTHSLI